MVTIVDFKPYLNKEGEEFFALVVQGQVEAVKSETTGRTYFTAREAKVPCTFNEATCKSLIGTEFPGTIKKVAVEPYDYRIPDTDEVITLNHRYEYQGDDESIVKDNVVEAEAVL